MTQSSRSKVLDGHMLNSKILVLIVLALSCCNTLSADDRSFFEFMLAIRLINDPRVCEELDISKSQRDELAEKTRTIQRNAIRLEIGLRRKGIPAYEENVRKAAVFVAEGEATIRDVILGFQYDRLLQIARQKQVAMFVPTSGLTKPEYADAIGLNNGDKKKIKELEEEMEHAIIKLHEKFNSDMKKLLALRNKRIKETLSEDQVIEFKRLFGEPYVPILEGYMASRYWENRAFSERITRELKEKRKLKLPK